MRRALVALAATAALAGCSGSGSGLPQGADAVELDPADFISEITNPWLPYATGASWVYRETDGEGGVQRVEVRVLDETRVVMGIEARVVHDVVMEEGGRVDEFDERGGGNMGGIPRPGSPGGEHDEQRPQALSAAFDDVIPDLVDQHDVAGQLAADLGVDRGQVAGDEGSYVLELHGFPASPRGSGILAANRLAGNAGYPGRV